ncbi:MAG: IS5 family transposase [Thermogutta sp.]
MAGTDGSDRATLSQEGQPGHPVSLLPWMIKLYFLQIWFGLPDSQTEEMMHDSLAVREFLGLDLGRDRPPDETTILRFRHLIEKHNLAEQILRIVNAHLEKAGIWGCAGTIVDATVIAAPRSTKNKSRERYPEKASTKKVDQWQFKAKLHVGVDSRSKVMHTLQMTPANVHAGQVVEQLLHGEERTVYFDKAYVGK